MPESESTSARKGKATEHLIAASCILASNGQLNALTGLVDDEGVDVTFKRRDGFRTVDVQIKSRFLASSKNLRKNGTFVADTREATFRPRDDLYMLFVVVEAKTATFGPVWLVPSTVLDQKAFRVTVKKKKLVRFQASSKKNSKDKWRAYRMSAEKLAPELLRIVKSLEN
ncbi:MAG TPA: hypothetical protein VN458_00195 [Solirubrobacterales bacterium]|nr:hypothetical protein [Solirubrobacterales bacterium]